MHDPPVGYTASVRVHPTVELLAAYAWRLIVIAVVAISVLWLIGQLWVVFMALAIALMLTRALDVPARWLRARMHNALAATLTVVGFLVVLGGVLTLVGAAVVNEAGDIGPTVSQAIDDVEDWLVEDAPFDVDRADIEDFRTGLNDQFNNAVRDSSGSIVSGAVIAVEIFFGLLLGLIITLFTIKDGERFVRWVQRQLPEDKGEITARVAARAWRTLGGYLRGAALLGLLEGVIIGITLTVVGAELAVPMGVLTFMAAFVPFVGAIVAGALSVAVALATAGFAEALVVLVVAVAVQQLDNDLLAPWIYGKALEIHPVVVLLAITAGGTMFGIAGSFLAVPVVAVLVNSIGEIRNGEPAAE